MEKKYKIGICAGILIGLLIVLLLFKILPEETKEENIMTFNKINPCFIDDMRIYIYEGDKEALNHYCLDNRKNNETKEITIEYKVDGIIGNFNIIINPNQSKCIDDEIFDNVNPPTKNGYLETFNNIKVNFKNSDCRATL